MKTAKTLLSALFAASLVALTAAGCSEIEMFSVDAPADLQSRIDAIAEAKKKKDTGDTTYVDITKAIVGAEDNTTAWWGDHSQSFEIPAGKLLHFEFVNGSSKNNNWSNWNVVCTTNGDRDASDYSEYFVIRSDAYGWGNADYASTLLSQDYFEEGKLADWDVFRTQFMDGAYVTIEIDHATAGYAYMTAYSYNSDFGFGITETYNHPVSATSSIYSFITTDESHFEMKKAYLIPSKIQEIPDEDVVSITVSGTPAALEIGSEDFWGNAVATVTYADGSTAEAAFEDITFSVPDLTTLGTKTIVYSYNKTKQGNFCKSVVGSYTLEVVNPIVALEASATAYLIGGAKYVTLDPASIQVTATYSDDSQAKLVSSQYSVEFTDGKFIYEGVPGTYENAYTVSITTASGEVVSTTGALTIAASEHPAQAEPVGAPDFTNGWWLTFSQDWTVAPGTSQSVSMKVSSDNLGNWHSPCVVMRRADIATEFGVTRQDNYGWGGNYDSWVMASDWNWDTFMSSIDGSEVAITVSNHGDNTASVRYHVIYANGEEHFQYYDNIAIDSNDFQFAVVCEESYLVFD